MDTPLVCVGGGDEGREMGPSAQESGTGQGSYTTLAMLEFARFEEMETLDSSLDNFLAYS